MPLRADTVRALERALESNNRLAMADEAHADLWLQDDLRDALVNTQETRGEAAGSWDPRGEHASAIRPPSGIRTAPVGASVSRTSTPRSSSIQSDGVHRHP